MYFSIFETHLDVSLLRLALAAAALINLRWVCKVIYNLYFSPISGVPGPKIAAATFWYEFYYDVWERGKYTFKLQELHKQYGPVVRMNPYEVHVNDPEMYDYIYVGPSKRPTDEWEWSTQMFQAPTSTVSTVPHELHRRRRAMYSNYFSTSSVHKLEPLVRSMVTKLMSRVRQVQATKRPLPLSYVYSALTIDVISLYSFGKAYGCLDLPEYAKDYDNLFTRISQTVMRASKHLPLVASIANSMPTSLSNLFLLGQRQMQEMQAMFTSQAQAALDEFGASDKEVSKTSDGAGDIPKSIFQSMIQANVPASEKSLKRLAEEAQLLIVAGTLTTAHTLMTITWHVLNSPQILSRLHEEIQQAEIAYMEADGHRIDESHALPLKELESLSYLTAIIREGLRLGTGVPHRLQRLSPNTALNIHGFTLPPGTPVSMSSYLMHYNPDTFPEPETFNPDRWLPLKTNGARLNKYLVAFSKGSRQCMGINLAWAEMYMTIATLFNKRAPTLTLFDTTFERDVKVSHDGFNPTATVGSEGLKVLVE